MSLMASALATYEIRSGVQWRYATYEVFYQEERSSLREHWHCLAPTHHSQWNHENLRKKTYTITWMPQHTTAPVCRYLVCPVISFVKIEVTSGCISGRFVARLCGLQGLGEVLAARRGQSEYGKYWNQKMQKSPLFCLNALYDIQNPQKKW